MNEDSSAVRDMVRRHRRRVVTAMLAGALVAVVLVLLGWAWTGVDPDPGVGPTPGPATSPDPSDQGSSPGTGR